MDYHAWMETLLVEIMKQELEDVKKIIESEIININ